MPPAFPKEPHPGFESLRVESGGWRPALLSGGRFQPLQMRPLSPSQVPRPSYVHNTKTSLPSSLGVDDGIFQNQR